MSTSRSALITITTVALAACGGSADTSPGAATRPPAASSTPSPSAAVDGARTATSTTVAAQEPISTSPDTTDANAPSVDGREALAQRCALLGEALAGTPFPSSPTDVPAFAEQWREWAATAPTPDLPDGVVGEVGDLRATIEAMLNEVDAAVDAATGEDPDAAWPTIERADDLLIQTAGMSVLAGVECLGLDPARLTEAAVSAPVLGAWQIENAFGSIWVSREQMHEVVRIDPSTGEMTAKIPVGSRPFKLQGADGRVWVRTAEAFEAIDPDTGAVTATLLKSDVGGQANRSWAVDGALWICDGTVLHRYDPKTVELIASIELGLPCGQVHATTELATAWTYNEDDGESGDSAAVFVDPTTNTVLGTVALPVDVGVPVVLDDRVVFPGYKGSTAVIVDRDTWAVDRTVDLGARTGGSQSAFDGSVMYVPTDDKLGLLVVDPTSYEVVDTILPFEVNSVVAADGGGVWTASNTINYVQRFDRSS